MELYKEKISQAISMSELQWIALDAVCEPFTDDEKSQILSLLQARKMELGV
jgi:hypothetical protein